MCEYCDGKMKKLPLGFVNRQLYGSSDGHIYKQKETGMWFLASQGHKNDINIPIKYCPYCGKDLYSDYIERIKENE